MHAASSVGHLPGAFGSGVRGCMHMQVYICALDCAQPPGSLPGQPHNEAELVGARTDQRFPSLTALR
jgi:hypothetical protein